MDESLSTEQAHIPWAGVSTLKREAQKLFANDLVEQFQFRGSGSTTGDAYFGLVGFSANARVVGSSGGTPSNDVNTLASRIDDYRSDGSTNPGSGLARALTYLANFADPARSSVVLIVQDGPGNIGRFTYCSENNFPFSNDFTSPYRCCALFGDCEYIYQCNQNYVERYWSGCSYLERSYAISKGQALRDAGTIVISVGYSFDSCNEVREIASGSSAPTPLAYCNHDLYTTAQQIRTQ